MPIICKLSIAAFKLQSYAVVTETIWPAKPKIFTIWLFKEKVCQPLVYTINDLITTTYHLEEKKAVPL